jgi:MFS family permease
METLKKTLRDKPALRWLVLLLGGIVIFTNYYLYDALSPIKAILEKDLGFDSTDYGFFVSFYSFPNTFLAMAVIGGIVLDKIGIRKTGLLFVSFMAFGGLITAYGASEVFKNGGIFYDSFNTFLTKYSPELKMMSVGRFFYGLGAETSIVVISKILVKWFKGRNLALAFGLKIGFGRLGTMVALNLSPILADGEEKVGFAVWFAAILVGIGLIVFFIYSLMDLTLDKQIEQSEEITKPDKFDFKDIVNLLTNRTFIFIAIICVTFYSAVFPFLSFAPDFIHNKFGVSLALSGRISSLVPLSTALVTPLFGLFIDKKGRSASVMFIGAIILLFVHLTFAFTSFSPYIPMILLGIAFSLVPASMWPTLVRLVPESKIGTAYGLMYSIQNLGLWVFPILAGIILDKTNPGVSEAIEAGKNVSYDYTMTILMFAVLGVMGVLFAYLLKREDKIKGLGIDLPLNKQ